MIRKSAAFGFVFLIIDFVLYFLINVIITVAFKPFGIIDILSVSSLALLSRLIYLQAPAQFLLLGLVRYNGWHDNIIIVLIVCVLAFFLPSLYFLKSSLDFLKLFTFSYELKIIGEGLILISSVILTWVMLFKLTKWREFL